MMLIMEKTISSYNEKNVRLQLVKIYENDNPNWIFEIRFNRTIVDRFTRDQALFARLLFVHQIHDIFINHRSPLSKLT